VEVVLAAPQGVVTVEADEADCIVVGCHARKYASVARRAFVHKRKAASRPPLFGNEWIRRKPAGRESAPRRAGTRTGKPGKPVAGAPYFLPFTLV